MNLEEIIPDREISLCSAQSDRQGERRLIASLFVIFRQGFPHVKVCRKSGQEGAAYREPRGQYRRTQRKAEGRPGNLRHGRGTTRIHSLYHWPFCLKSQPVPAPPRLQSPGQLSSSPALDTASPVPDGHQQGSQPRKHSGK